MPIVAGDHHSHAGCDAERRLQAFAAASDEIVWELDREGTITYVSATVERHLGYRPVELVGQRWQAIMPTSAQDRGVDLIDDATVDTARWDDEDYVFTTKAGQLRPMHSAGLAELDSNGDVIGVAGILRPIRPDPAPDDQHMRQILDDIIGWRLIEPVFQPVVDLTDGRTIAVEALSRFPFHPRRSPAQLFGYAGVLGLHIDLELVAVQCALIEAQRLPAHLAISINVSPDTLASDRLHSFITTAGVPPERTIIEITEQMPVAEYAPILAAADQLRSHGCRLAVDDAGAGYASFKHILTLSPELIKLDRFLVTGIATDPARRALIRSVAAFAHDVGADIVAEGIETSDQSAAVRDLGVRYGQGYLIAPPMPIGQLAVHLDVPGSD